MYYYLNINLNIIFLQAAEQHALEENHYNFLKKMVQV